MSLRQKLSDNPVISVLVAVVVLGAAGWMLVKPRHHVVVEQGYYFNLDENKLFVDTVGQNPPFTTADGHTAVVAAVFACGDCADTSGRFVGYLEKYSDELREAMASGAPIEPETAKEGHVVRTESGGEWIPSSSSQGQEIVAEIQKRCGDQRPKACQP